MRGSPYGRQCNNGSVLAASNNSLAFFAAQGWYGNASDGYFAAVEAFPVAGFRKAISSPNSPYFSIHIPERSTCPSAVRGAGFEGPDGSGGGAYCLVLFAPSGAELFFVCPAAGIEATFQINMTDATAVRYLGRKYRFMIILLLSSVF